MKICWKMGCVTSKKDINDLHPNIFQVANVDDKGNRISSGQLEIKDTELVLYQRGKPPICWPLKTLRRYGYEDQVFSFEAGRRCPTGSGIYAFSCRRAEKLFNYVQSHTQMRNVEWSHHDTSVTNVARNSDYLEPRPRLSVTNGPSSRLSSVGSSNASPSPPPTNLEFPPPYNNYYANDAFIRGDEQGISSSPVSPSAPCIPEVEEDPDALTPVYMNVNTGAGLNLQAPPQPSIPEEEEEKHCYMNLVPGVNAITLGPPPPPARQMSLPIAPPPIEPERVVNYAVLDLNGGEGSPPAPPSPAPRPSSQGYVTIDFDKTVALSHSVNPNCIDDEGSRKTRHDIATPRQSTSLSD